MRTISRSSFDLASAMGAVADLPPAELSVGELIKAFGTVRCDGSDTRLRKWTAAFGTTSAWKLTSEELEHAAQAMLNHGYRPSAINRDLSALGSAYRWARSKRFAPRGFRSPTLGVARFEESIRRVHLDNTQVDAVRSRALAFRDRAFGVYVALLIDTGARKSELLGRYWKEIDLGRREVLAPMTKNGSPRVLFFSQETADLIERVFPRRDADRLVFEGRVPGNPISFRKAWATTTADVGLPDLRMHDMRHAAAASLLRAGVTLGVAAQVLGHDAAVLARRYGHLETAALKAAQELSWAK